MVMKKYNKKSFDRHTHTHIFGEITYNTLEYDCTSQHEKFILFLCEEKWVTI